MPSTARLGLVLLAEASENKATVINTALTALDAGVGVLAAANTFTQTNTFSGTLAHTGSLLGFYGATPVAQQAQTVDLRTVLISLGLMSNSSGATPLSLNGGNITAGQAILSSGIRGNGGAISLGQSTVTVTDGADTTLSAAEMATGHLVLTGTLTASRNVIAPNTTGGIYSIINNTTGGFSVVVKTAAGTGVTVGSTKACLAKTGANVIRLSADV